MARTVSDLKGFLPPGKNKFLSSRTEGTASRFATCQATVQHRLWKSHSGNERCSQPVLGHGLMPALQAEIMHLHVSRGTSKHMRVRKAGSSERC